MEAMKSITIEGTKRAAVGQKAAKQTRREGCVPCVLYGGTENVHFTVTQNDISKIIYTPNFYLADLSIEGEKHTAILKDLQTHPISDSVMHVDFLKLTDDRKVIVEIPLVFDGQSKGEKAGGKLLAQMRKLRVKCLPKDLISEIKVDVRELELGRSIKVNALDLPSMEIMNPLGAPMATIEIPRSLRSAAAQKEAEAAE